MKTKLSISDLEQFCGTAYYYRHLFGRFAYTDGVKYLAENGGTNGAYWLLDAIGSHLVTNPVFQKSPLKEFHFWHLKVNPETKSALLTCSADAGVKPSVTQRIPFTDFQFDVMLFCGYQEEIGFVLMLPSEY